MTSFIAVSYGKRYYFFQIVLKNSMIQKRNTWNRQSLVNWSATSIVWNIEQYTCYRTLRIYLLVKLCLGISCKDEHPNIYYRNGKCWQLISEINKYTLSVNLEIPAHTSRFVNTTKTPPDNPPQCLLWKALFFQREKQCIVWTLISFNWKIKK